MAGLVLVASIVVAPAAGATDPSLPPPEALPSNVVAFVAHVPVSLGRLTEAEFQRALLQATAQAGRSTVPGPHAKSYGRIADNALSESLESIWIQGQAREMGVGVRPREVSRLLTRLKREAFDNDNKRFRRFLREAHYTRHEIRERAMVQILAEKIQVRAIAGVRPKEESRVFSRFVKEYEERWQSRTVCAEGYVTERCSNAP